ncbi:hypothetical protein F5J12DRAFT_785252 [Pisolithus orientalis]|uniref:uncharacterized protein n=1 Tax=Pisolithus orientalis TaxID=936130 RepID=UPI002225A287|nr:uncharacterized protein F5J12DRAFT_785252 [Pisolithus orientalis]KAI5996825.1 hypothetical protein F5J12DRAFT_785252 [Pisolithus orientalis]
MTRCFKKHSVSSRLSWDSGFWIFPQVKQVEKFSFDLSNAPHIIMDDSLHTMVVRMLKAAFGTAPMISSSSIFSNHQLRKPRLQSLAELIKVRATLQGESGLTSDVITSLEVRLASAVITHAILNPYVSDWDADRFSEPLVNAKDRTIHFENPKIGYINAPATVLDVHGRVIVWYLPGIIPDARIGLTNLKRLVDTLYQSTSLKQKANREWLLKISYVEHFWSNIAKVSLPDMARASGQAMLARAGRVENEISLDWPSVYTNIDIIVNQETPSH